MLPNCAKPNWFAAPTWENSKSSRRFELRCLAVDASRSRSLGILETVRARASQARRNRLRARRLYVTDELAKTQCRMRSQQRTRPKPISAPRAAMGSSLLEIDTLSDVTRPLVAPSCRRGGSRAGPGLRDAGAPQKPTDNHCYWGSPVCSSRKSRRSPAPPRSKSNIFSREPASSSNDPPPILPVPQLSSMKRSTEV